MFVHQFYAQLSCANSLEVAAGDNQGVGHSDDDAGILCDSVLEEEEERSLTFS